MYGSTLRNRKNYRFLSWTGNHSGKELGQRWQSSYELEYRNHMAIEYYLELNNIPELIFLDNYIPKHGTQAQAARKFGIHRNRFRNILRNAYRAEKTRIRLFYNSAYLEELINNHGGNYDGATNKRIRNMVHSKSI